MIKRLSLSLFVVFFLLIFSIPASAQEGQPLALVIRRKLAAAHIARSSCLAHRGVCAAVLAL